MSTTALETTQIEQLAIVGYELWRSQLIGTAPPVMQRRNERMKKPIPGDLCIETSSLSYNRLHRKDWLRFNVGTLIKITWEPIDMEWDESQDGPKPTERCIYFRLLDDGTEFRWTNAHAVTILPVEGWL
jgi:hypothetical protein